MLEEMAKIAREVDEGTIVTTQDDAYVALARGFLDRLRNPTEAMIHAGRAMLTHRGCNPLTGDTEEAWQAMIDAALAGSE